MNTELLNTDELFKVLPNAINDKGTLYFIHVVKGNNGVLVWYAKNQSEGGQYLDNTYRKGDTLKEALKEMLDWLIQFNYLNEYQTNILQDIINTKDTFAEHVISCVKMELKDPESTTITINKVEDGKAEIFVNGKYTGRHKL